MAPTNLNVKPSLRETNIGNAGSVAEATSAKKRQKITEMELYKVSNNRSSPQRTRASRAAARVAREGVGDLAVFSQYDSSDDEPGDEDKGLNDDDDDLNEVEEPIEEEAAAEAAKTKATRTRAEVANKVESNDGAKTDGHGLRHGMARLEAAMAVSGSKAARFAERAWASRATTEEAATEHEGVCRAIVEDQAGALGEALGPTATGGPTWPCSTQRASSR